MASCGMQPANQKENQELARVARQVAERSSKILGEFAQKQAQSMSSAARDEMGIAKAFMDLYARLAADPALLASMSMNFWVDQWRLWQSSWQKMFGLESHPIAEPARLRALDLAKVQQAGDPNHGLASADNPLQHALDAAFKVFLNRLFRVAVRAALLDGQVPRGRR